MRSNNDESYSVTLVSIGSFFRINMKSDRHFVSPAGRIFLIGLAAIVVAAISGPAPTKAQKAESPSAVHTVSIVGVSGLPGTQVTIAIELESGGDEVAGGFSLNFDQTKLSISGVSSPSANPDVTLGTGVPPGMALTVNATQVGSGRIGVLFDSSNPFTISPPNRQVVRFRFTILGGAAAGDTPITFGNVPAPRSFSDGFGNDIPMTYVPGAITIQQAAPPVTVSGRVTSQSGRGVTGAVVSMVDSVGAKRVATTSTFGYYIFTGVPSGLNYTITPTAKRYTFTPVNMTITTDLTDLNFVAQ